MCHHAHPDNKTNVAVTHCVRPLKWKFIALNGIVGISKYDTSPPSAPGLVPPLPFHPWQASPGFSTECIYRRKLSLKDMSALPATAD